MCAGCGGGGCMAVDVEGDVAGECLNPHSCAEGGGHSDHPSGMLTNTNFTRLNPTPLSPSRVRDGDEGGTKERSISSLRGY